MKLTSRATFILVLTLVWGCGNGKNTGDADSRTDAVTDAADEEVIGDVVEEDVPVEGDVVEDAADASGEWDAVDAGWVNPGCDAEANVVEAGFAVDVVVDITGYNAGEFLVTQSATVTPPEAGSAISLFGIGVEMLWSDRGYRHESGLVTFCTDPFEAGQTVTVEAEFLVHEASISMGLRRWRSSDGTFFVVGPSQEPYFAPYWLLVPQSTHNVDPDHDHSPAVQSVDLTVVAPDESWTVMGPSGPGVQDGVNWSFSLDTVQPIYDISFAASPFYEVFDVGTTTSGVQVIGAVTPARRTAAEACFPAAIQTIEWMEANVGPWEWGDYLTLAEVPDFGGAMEHTTVMWFDSDTIVAGPEGDQIVIHETVHHWWGNSVRFADWPHFWIAEGFDEWHTNYNIMEMFLSEEGFQDLRVMYRERAAELSYPYMASWPDPGPLRFADEDDVMMQWMTSMSLFYVYGATFLEMVNQRLLRDFSTDLNTVLAGWYDEKRLQSATTEQFLTFLETETGDDTYWQPLFDDWVYQTPAPTLVVSGYEYTGTEASVTLIRVDGSGQDMPDLEVVFTSGADEHLATADLSSGTGSATATVAMGTEPDGIVLDPDINYIFRFETEADWAGPEVGFSL